MDSIRTSSGGSLTSFVCYPCRNNNSYDHCPLIGIAIGVFLYKTNILIISKLSNGILYGLFAGSVVYIVFFIPVYESVLTHEIASTLNTVEGVEIYARISRKEFLYNYDWLAHNTSSLRSHSWGWCHHYCQ